MFNTPILFLVFNRPELTEITFNRIRMLKPLFLFVAADGPRSDRPEEAALCARTRDIIKKVDWPCEVKTLFREENLGCGVAVSEAITWFFNEVEEGIIIEDDCLPDLSFFAFCADLLNRYRFNGQVMHIGGVNFQEGQKRGNGDYYFSAVAHVWGWATWRRAWQKYRLNIPSLEAFFNEKKLGYYFDNKIAKEHWAKTFQSIEKHEIDTWDHQWTYCIYNNKGVSIVPNQNLISNIGFGEDATHTTNLNQYSNLITQEIKFPLKHPEYIGIDKEADLYFFRDFDKLFENTKTSSVTFSYKVRNTLISMLEHFLKRNILSRTHNKKSNNILFVKPDAIGDFFITQSFFDALKGFRTDQDQNFYLLANIRLKSYLDKNKPAYIKEVIYYDQQIQRRFKQLYGFYFKVRKYKFKTVYNLMFSRTYQVDEIVNFTGAREKVCFIGDTANISNEEKQISDLFYTQLIDVKNVKTEIVHESKRLRVFFEKILEQKIKGFQDGYLAPSTSCKSKVILICPGSNEDYKKWNPIYYSLLINMLQENDNGYIFKIFCGPGEAHLGEIISANCKTALVKNSSDINTLVDLVSESELIIGNDSAPMHIAVAIGKPFVCVFNGTLYGRFLPYLELDTTKYIVVMPDAVDEAIKEHDQKLFYYNNKIKRNINTVPVLKVFEACIKILKSYK